MRTIKTISKTIVAILIVLMLYTVGFASSLNIVQDGAWKGNATTRMTSSGTDIAVDEVIAALGYERSGDEQSVVAAAGGKKLEFWNKSDVVRICGNMVVILTPVDFADGHWWVEKKAAQNIFSQFNILTGKQGALSFTEEAIVGSPALKTSVAVKKTTAVAPAKQQKNTGKRMTVKQLIAERQKRNAAARVAQPEVKATANNQMSDTDKFLAELAAKSEAEGKKQAQNSVTATSQQETAKPTVTEPTVEQNVSVAKLQAEKETNPEPTQNKALAAIETEPAAPAVNLVKKEFTGKRPRVVIDAGHGAHDPGAIGNSTREKDINLKAAITLGNILKQYGADVLYTRSTDVFLKLQERTAFANKNNADVFISLHCNSLPKATDSVRGIEIYLMASPRDKDSLRLAIEENKEVSGSANSVADLQNADKKTKLLLKILGDMQQTNKISESTELIESLDKSIKANRLQLRKVSQAPFFVLRGAGMPAVLIEMGYLSSASDTRRLNNPAYREQIALSVAQGVVSYIKTHIKL